MTVNTSILANFEVESRKRGVWDDSDDEAEEDKDVDAK